MNTTGRKTVKARTTSAPKKIEKTAEKASITPTAANEVSNAATEIASQASATPPVAAPLLKLSPTREQIALRAYQLYLARGSEPGHDSEDWLAAEAELSA